jgi:hypothetical protein
MSRPQTQAGYIFESGNAWHLRFNVHENGKRRQRSVKLCGKDSEHPSKDSMGVRQLAADLIGKINAANAVNDSAPGHSCPVCGNRCKRTIQGKFAPKEQHAE